MAFEERYYREELDYLRQLGKLLARDKPYLSRFLAEKEGDPDVERLMEASAFLAGGVRQKLEDAFPEFTHGIIRMLWPNYLRPVPSMSVIEYQPEGNIQAPVPSLAALRFNDRSPFISDATRQWLADEPAKTAGSVMDEDELTQQVWQSYREQGLEAALALAEQQPQHNQRARFYSQYLTAQLLEASGMAQLAQQHYRMLFKTGLHTMLSDWEPSLLEQLEDKLTPEQ